MNAVTPGLRSDINNGVSDAGCCGIEDIISLSEADGHGIDQNIAVVTGVEITFPANRRHADAVTIATDTGDNT